MKAKKLIAIVFVMVLLASMFSAERVLADLGTVMFIDSGQSLGNFASYDMTMGDLDSDGDLDAFVVNRNQADIVWLNDGSTIFTDSGQRLHGAGGYGVALGDLDSDGDLDAFVVNGNFDRDFVWLNDGNGVFTDTGQRLGNWGRQVALGDVDGDGDLDAFVTVAEKPNRVWLNDGSGTFFDSGQTLGNSSSTGVALGDLDADGDLDAFIANGKIWAQPNKVWLNDGSGTFNDSGQELGNSHSWEAALGDLDSDGDLDAFVANSREQANRIWLNDGAGVFILSDQSLGNSSSTGVALGDIDDDGDFDAFVGNYPADKVWLNDGAGFFSENGQSLGNSISHNGVELGDLDGDGDLDAFAAYVDQGNLVWLNIAANRPPQADSGGPYSSVEGIPIIVYGSSSIDPDGDPLSFEWDLDNDGEFDDAFGVTAETSYPDNGVFTVGLRVTDDFGAYDTDTAEIIILNVSPTVKTGDDVTLHEGSTFISEGSFSDPGADTWTAVVDYGDGFGFEQLMLNPDNSFTLEHIYNDSGVLTLTVIVTDDDGGEGIDTLTITVLTPQETLQYVIDNLQGLVNSNPGTPLADKLEDSIAKIWVAVEELDKAPPDNQAAVNNLEGAVGDLEAAVKDGLLDPVEGIYKMNILAGVARQLAVDAIDQAITLDGDPTVIAEAQQALDDGDAFRSSGTFKDAVNKYKDALAKAESAH